MKPGLACESGSNVREGARDVVSLCADCYIAMLRGADLIQKMEPNWKAGVGIRMGQSEAGVKIG